MPAGPLVSIDPKDRTPIYAQLERGLRAAIASGRLRSGDQLPTVRQLAVDLRVNANTVIPFGAVFAYAPGGDPAVPERSIVRNSI